MISSILNLANWQKYLGIIALIGSIIGGALVWFNQQLDQSFQKGYEAASVEFKTEQNILIAAQNEKHKKEIKQLVLKHSLEVEEAIADVELYWQDVYKKKEASIIETYEKKLKIAEINNEASNITDLLHDDTVRLLKQTFSTVSPPSYYELSITRETETTSDR